MNAILTSVVVFVFMVLTLGFGFCVDLCVNDWNCNLHDSGLFGFQELAVYISLMWEEAELSIWEILRLLKVMNLS